MYLLSWVVLGMFIGWAAGRALKGNGYGPFMDATMGIGGAVGGGLLMRSANIDGFGGTIVTTLAAVTGAVVLTVFVGLANGRRVNARLL
jgi:uncharacterized membrane protein YeaQ/YmgE (transglycosylase-associated protein family)